MLSTTDGELLRRYTVEGSEDAFRELVARHVDLVYSAALRQVHGRRHLAEDVSQLVFIEMARQAGRLAPHPSVRGWLFLCTRNLAARALRAEWRRLARETIAHAMNEPSSPAATEGESILPVLDEALSRLKEQDREALFLRFFDKCTFADLGVHLGVSEDAARRRVDRALDRVRSLLARRGVVSSAAILGAVLTADTVKAAPQGLTANIAQAALGAASHAPSALLTTFALMKSTALSTAFITLVALAGVAAGGAGLYYRSQLDGDQAFANAGAKAIASAELRLAAIKRHLARSAPAGSAIHAGAKAPPAGTSLEDQVARDLELNRWLEQYMLAKAMLTYGPFLAQHGATTAQIQQLYAAAGKTIERLDDLREIARLTGAQDSSDPDLAAKASQIDSDYQATAAAILGPDLQNALHAYAASTQGPSQNGSQAGEAAWVAEQVAGVAFAAGSPLPANQQAQLMQLLVKYTPNYPPGTQNTSYASLNWAGILAEAQQTAPPAELAAVQSFYSASTVWTMEDKAKEAAAKTATP